MSKVSKQIIGSSTQPPAQKRLGEDDVGSENDVPAHQSDTEIAIETLGKLLATNQPSTISIGPKSIEKLRYFLEKPYHGKAVRGAVEVLTQAFSSETLAT